MATKIPRSPAQLNFYMGDTMKKNIVKKMIQADLMLELKMSKAKADLVSCQVVCVLEGTGVVKFEDEECKPYAELPPDKVA